jgi:hypothetical protein
MATSRHWARTRSGYLVAAYHLGSPGGPVTTAERSWPGNGLCEHLLMALAGTEGCR